MRREEREKAINGMANGELSGEGKFLTYRLCNVGKVKACMHREERAGSGKWQTSLHGHGGK